MEKLIKRFEEIYTEDCIYDSDGFSGWMDNYKQIAKENAEEFKNLAIEFSKYIRVNDYLPQLLENGDIGYVKSNEIWRASSPAKIHSKDVVFNSFIDKYYE